MFTKPFFSWLNTKEKKRSSNAKLIFSIEISFCYLRTIKWYFKKVTDLSSDEYLSKNTSIILNLWNKKNKEKNKSENGHFLQYPKNHENIAYTSNVLVKLGYFI